MINFKYFSILCLIGTLCTFCGFQNYQPNPITLEYNTDNYDKIWKQIDSLEREGRPKSALELVEQLYQKAKEENNPAQLIKTNLFKAKYLNQLEEDGLYKAINQLRTEADEVDFPTKPILQSMLGELYTRYAQNHRWQLRDRTTIDDYKPEDIRTWSLENFMMESMLFYQRSVQDKRTQQVRISDFREITQNNESKFRPTLYDFLVHRALDHYNNDQSMLPEPSYVFTIDQEAAFSDAKEFANYKFETKDSTSAKYQAILLFQEILRFHQRDENPKDYIDADLKRLKFVNQHAVLEDKNALYLKALTDLAAQHKDQEAWSEIMHYIAQWNMQMGNQYQEGVDTAYQFILGTAVSVAEKAIEKYPNSFGAKNCQALLAQIKRKQLTLDTELVYLPNEAALAKISYRNLEKVYLKLIPITYDEKEILQQKRNNERLSYLNRLKPSKIWAEMLPQVGDYRQHSVEIKIDPQQFGLYILMVSDTEKFTEAKHSVNYAIFHVSNLSYLHWNNSGNPILAITHRKTGAPLADVNATFYFQNYNPSIRRSEWKKQKSYTSDAQGFVMPKSLDSNKNYRVHLKKDEDELRLDDGVNNRYYEHSTNAYEQTHLFLDRAIYRPGQTVYFKALVLNIDKKSMPSILPNKKVKVTFRDANYQEISTLDVVTNEFGTVNGSFTAPASGLLGQMTIETSTNGYKSFRVEEYKRPKFEVSFEDNKESFRLGDKITVKGLAKAFAGNVIDGAEVQYRVVRNVRYPYWEYWRRGSQPSSSMEIINGKTKTNEKGEFEVEFELIPDKKIAPKLKPTFSYTITADVTDITGETQSSTNVVRAGYIGMNASINVPQKAAIDSLTSWEISTKNWSDQAVPAKGLVKITELKTPKTVFINRYWSAPDQHILSEEAFKTAFPNYAFKKEHEIQNWAKGKEVLSQQFDTEKSKTIDLSAINWKTGAYKVHLKTSDTYGNKIEVERFICLTSLKNKTLAVQEQLATQLENNTYQPNETARIYLDAHKDEIHTLVDIHRKDKAVQTKWHNIKDWKTLEIPITESDRGNAYVNTTFVKNNRFYRSQTMIPVPWTNKELKIEYSTFRDKLYPGQEEEWEIKISGHQKEAVAAEMVASLYDASLDQFAANNWGLNLYRTFSPEYGKRWNESGFRTANRINLSRSWNPSYSTERRLYPTLNWFNFSYYSTYGSRRYRGGRNIEFMDQAVEEAPMMSPPRTAEPPPPAPKVRSKRAKSSDVQFDTVVANQGMVAGGIEEAEGEMVEDVTVDIDGLRDEAPSTNKEDFDNVNIRTNLKETVFFFPNLQTDEEGNIRIKFTMNEALTKWKFLALAHTKDLQIGSSSNTTITQKDLMVVPNAPRFLREGDEVEFTAKVSNLTKNALQGEAVLQLFDAISMQPIDDVLGNQNAVINFNAAAGQSDRLAWKLKIPHGKVQAITHRVIAKAGNFSDGEESTLPVLTNRMLVTETMPLPIGANEEKTFTFSTLLNKNSTSLQHHNYTLEFTSNPAWYAVQSLPYLMEYPHQCTEQIFSRMYANSLATSVANSHPKIKRVFESWKNTDALLSNLSKNQELKSALLAETPWVLNAQSEEEQKKRIGLLFDLNKMEQELTAAIDIISERQLSNGGFSWFPGGRDSRYITQYLVEGMGHLQKLNALYTSQNSKLKSLLPKAIRYTDDRIVEDYQKLEKRVNEGRTKWEDDHLTHIAIHYLYTRSFFLDQQISPSTQKVIDYYLSQSEEYWLKQSLYSQGLIALAANRFGKKDLANKIIVSLEERSLYKEEMGRYWKYNRGYFWYQMPIETHSLMIEVFDEVGNDAKMVNDLKVWLLKNKQTTHWKTTKATASAVYALLMTGDNWLLNSQPVEISTGNSTANQKITTAQNRAEAGTGYFKTQWSGGEINQDFSTITVNNPNSSIAWGAAYWQYFEDLDKITTFEETPLTLKKQLFKEIPSDNGPKLEALDNNEGLEVGDKVKVRIELRVDRDMEYVHLKDMRASGFEPINVLSQYKWQDGLGYYESTRDVATDFFISYLPKGTYVFEYPVRVSHKGDFSNGISSIQCMYAPEFSSHSEGIRVKVE